MAARKRSEQRTIARTGEDTRRTQHAAHDASTSLTRLEDRNRRLLWHCNNGPIILIARDSRKNCSCEEHRDWWGGPFAPEGAGCAQNCWGAIRLVSLLWTAGQPPVLAQDQIVLVRDKWFFLKEDDRSTICGARGGWGFFPRV